jgi:Tfp pilus assembly protein PilE
LIIVIVIIGILAMIAIPRYFANIESARKAEAVSTMKSIREGMMAYHAEKGVFPTTNTWPIDVYISTQRGAAGAIADMVVGEPLSSNFLFTYTDSTITATTKVGGSSYTMGVTTGEVKKL